TLSGSDYKYLDGRTLDNSGSAVWTGSGLIYTYNGAAWNNLPGSTLDPRSDTSFYFSGIGGLAPFNNQGTFRKSAGTGSTSICVAFNNSGSLDVQSGTVALTRGGSSTGTFSEAAGSRLVFSSGTYTLQAGASGAGLGSVEVRGHGEHPGRHEL